MYGDVVEELDWSVGQIMDALQQEGLTENTLVIFTSDNGPWLIFGLHGGSAGLLRDGKGSTWEGGVRVPCIMSWPGQIPAGKTPSDTASTLDILRTVAKLAGGKAPEDRQIDGFDLSPMLFKNEKSPRDTMFFYRGTRLFAVRNGPYKAHFITQSAYGPGKAEEHSRPLLYHLDHDPSEKHDIGKKNPAVIDCIREIVAAHQATMKPGANQLEGKLSKKKSE